MHLLAPTAVLRKCFAAAITCSLMVAVATPAQAHIQPGTNGRNVVKVQHSRGSFSLVGTKLWKEQLGGGVGYFRETHRDQWSVYLVKNNGVRIMLDMYQKKIYQQTPNGRTPLYRVIAASKRQQVISRSPRILSPRSGSTLPQSGWRFSWTRVPGATMYHLVVKNRNSRHPAVSRAVYGTSFTHNLRPGSYVSSHLLHGWTVKVRAKVNGSWKSFSPLRSFSVQPRNTRAAQVRLTTVTCRRLNEGNDEVYLRIMDGNGNVHTTSVKNFNYAGQMKNFNTRNFRFGRLGKVTVEIWEDDDFLRGDDDLLLRMEIYPQRNVLPSVVGGDGTYDVKFVKS